MILFTFSHVNTFTKLFSQDQIIELYLAIDSFRGFCSDACFSGEIISPFQYRYEFACKQSVC